MSAVRLCAIEHNYSGSPLLHKSITGAVLFRAVHRRVRAFDQGGGGIAIAGNSLAGWFFMAVFMVADYPRLPAASVRYRTAIRGLLAADVEASAAKRATGNWQPAAGCVLGWLPYRRWSAAGGYDTVHESMDRALAAPGIFVVFEKNPRPFVHKVAKHAGCGWRLPGAICEADMPARHAG